jgi:hypothetical protein
LAAIKVGATGDPFITETIPAFTVTFVLLMSFISPPMMKYSKFFEDLLVGKEQNKKVKDD